MLDSAFDRHLIEPVVKYRTDKYALQEGLISNLWQAWCVFCREIVIASAIGALTKGGLATTSSYATRSEMEIAFVASKAASRRSVGIVRPLVGKHLEPTWGDLTKINLIISALNCSNNSSLLSAFGAALLIDDLQLCRNTCAHLNSDTLSQLVSAKVRYNDTKFSHPSDVIFWVDPSSRDYLWKSWVDEMYLVTSFAIN